MKYRILHNGYYYIVQSRPTLWPFWLTDTYYNAPWAHESVEEAHSRVRMLHMEYKRNTAKWKQVWP